MSWFLDRVSDAREVLTDLLPETGEQFSGAVRKTIIEGDRWNANWKAQQDLTSDMIEKMGGFDVVAERYARERPRRNAKQDMDPRHNAAWVIEAAKDLADKEPELWGDLPRDMTSFNTAWKARLGAERNELSEMMGRGDAPWTQFAGEMIGSFDDIDVATAPLGGAPKAGVWGFARWMMTEGLIGAATEVPAAMAEQDQAKTLGFEPGNFWAQIGTAGVFSAGLAGVLGGGGKALEYAFGRRQGEDAAAAAAGEDPVSTRAQADATEEALRRGDPPPPPALLKPDPKLGAADDPAVQNVLSLITRIEAPKGFDQVSDFTVVAPPRPLSRMTVDEVLAWQSANASAGAESTAAGGFQIIQGTLSGLKESLRLKGDELFDEPMQRRMAVSLMEGRGLEDWRAGRISDDDFANNLAQEWAALPVVNGPNAGKSYYDKDGLNNAQVAVGETPDGNPLPDVSNFDFAPYVVEGGARADAITGLSDGFRTSLAQMIADAPPEIQAGLRIGSAYRSPERQAELWAEALQEYGSPEAARKWVAPPGNSQHNHGQAADLKFASPEVKEWVHANAEKYGLTFPLSNEDWHIEPKGARGGHSHKEPGVGGDTFLGVLGGEQVSDELLGPSRAGSGGGGGASRGGGGSAGGSASGTGGRMSFEELFSEVSTPAGTKVDVRYRVVEAADLRKATGDLQPRDRGRAASDDQVTKIARDLDPARLMPSPESDRGAPIIGPDMMIESGNGRVLGITRAADLNPEKYQAYVKAMQDRGFDTTGFKRPILVAERTTQMDFDGRVRFVRESNTSAIARMSATEQAKFDADYMSQRAFDAYRPDASIRNVGNSEFVRRVFAGITPEERAVLMTKDGKLSPEGNRRLTAALFARAFDADELLRIALEADDPAVTNMIRMMEDLAPNWAAFRAMVDAGYVAPKFDITDALTETIRIIVKARTENRQGQSVIGAIRDRLAQGDMFGEADPMIGALVNVFYKGDRARTPQATGDILQRYMAEVARFGRDDAPGIEDDISPLQAMQTAIGKEEAGAEMETLAPRVAEAESAEVDISGVVTAGFDEGAVAPALVAVADETIEQFSAAPVAVKDLASVLGDDPEEFVDNLAEAQPFKNFDDAYRRAAAAQANLSASGKRIAKDLPGVDFKDPGLKKRADAEEKVGRKGYAGPQGLTDISRAGFTVEKMDDADQIATQLAQDFDVVDEGWKRADSGYIDRKIILRHPDGTLSEVQIWTPAVLKAKDVETPFYNARRELPKGDPLRDTLRAKSKEIYDAAAGDSFASINFNADGISRSPNFLPKRSVMYSGSDVPLDVRSTSSASTSTQSAPGRSLAKAKSFPPGASAKTAGRASQLRNDSFIDDASVADVSDNSRMGTDPAPVNPGESEAPPLFDFDVDTATNRTSADIAADLQSEAALERAMISCNLKGTHK